MSEIEHGLRLYVCPDCYLTKMDAAQMPVHDRDCGGKFKPVEYVPAERLQGSVEALRQVRDYCAGMLAAIDSDPGAADIPGRGELLEDVLRRAGGQ